MNTRRWLITATACVLLLVALAGFKYRQIQAAIAFGASFPEPSETVQALTVSAQPSALYVGTIGEVVAPDALVLRNETEGRISAVNIVSGQQVSQGDVLVQLDVAEERARLKAAKANASLAQINLKRMQKLLDKGTVSRENLDQAQAQYDIAQAGIAELEATIAKKTLIAPFDALVGLHDLEVGEYLSANTALVELVGLNDFAWIDFNLPPAQGRLNVGDRVRVTLPGEEGELEAEVVAKNPSLSADSRNLRYRAKVPANEAIPPLSVVKLMVPVGSGDQVHVPTPAVLRDDLGAYVFRLQPDSSGEGYRAHRQSVALGKESDARITITRGLQSGDLVATDGAFKLHHGMLAYVGQRPADPELAEPAQPEAGEMMP